MTWAKAAALLGGFIALGLFMLWMHRMERATHKKLVEAQSALNGEAKSVSLWDGNRWVEFRRVEDK